MDNVYYSLYMQNILAFSKTLVIKCSAIADTLNDGLRGIGYVVGEDPLTWKYYMSLAGEYHPTDTRMYVRSMDTLERIEFSKANLSIHRATAREYRPGTRYYNALIEQYPDQVPLINGIIAPVDKIKAVDAQDGDILYFDPTRVENNETHLIKELQIWLKGFFGRWYNQQFMLSDDLFLPAFIGILYHQIPNRIHLIRLKAAKTPQAHSFHIREYLASNGRLDEYIPYLTREQQLYLYRNIRFIQRNVGKQEIFLRLVDQMLTKRGLPITGYRLRQNIEQLPDEIRPDVEMAKHPINFGYNQTGLNVESVHTILNREYGVARDNPIVQNDAELSIVENVSSSQFSSLPTKVLESEVVDRTNSSVRSIEHVLLNEWLHLSTNNRYRAFVNIPNPGSGEFMTMSVKDAFIVAMYAFAKARDILPPTIPRSIAYDVLRIQLPNYHELASIVDQRYVPAGMIEAIMDRVTPLGEYTSTETFYEAMANLHQEYLKLWELYSFQEHYITRGMCEQLVKRHFMNIKCTLVEEPTSFDQWLTERGYGIADLNTYDLEQLFVDCVRITTGANLVNRMTLGEIQQALLRMMGQLSSYSVQYLSNINHANFRYLGLIAIRAGDRRDETYSRYKLSGSRITALQLNSRLRQQYTVLNDDFMPPMTYRAHEQLHVHYDPRVNYCLSPSDLGVVKINAATVGVQGFSFTVDNPEPDPGDDDLEQYNL